MGRGPRIYNLFPRLAGTVVQWLEHLPRIAAMRFDWIYINPIHMPGFSGSLYAVKDYYEMNPLFRGDAREPADVILARFLEGAERRGLSVMMDLVVNHTAKDALFVDSHPEWYAREADGSLLSPFALDPARPGVKTVWGDLAEIDYRTRPEREGIIEEWRRLVRHYTGLGVRGFRCDAAYKVPADVWRPVIEAARGVRPDLLFLAETLGASLDQVDALAGAGFDFFYNSAKWWDFRSEWLLDQYERYRAVAPSIAFPETHDTERLIADLERQGVTETARLEAACRQRYLFAAVFASGVLMPMGYEFGFRRRLHVVETTPDHWEEPRFDISEAIAAINEMRSGLPVLNEEGPQRAVDGPALHGDAVALVRTSEGGGDVVLTVINLSPVLPAAVDLSAIPGLRAGEHLADLTPTATRRIDEPPDGLLDLAPLETRVFASGLDRRRTAQPAEPAAAVDRRGLRSRPVVIECVRPEIDGGRWPVKREVGDDFEVLATVFAEGHGKIAAVLQVRAEDEPEWTEIRMRLVNPGLDLWRGRIQLRRNARHLYTVSAWRDAFESWRDEVRKKAAAGQDVEAELREGHDLIEGACARAGPEGRRALDDVLDRDRDLPGPKERVALLVSGGVSRLMARFPDRSDEVRYDRILGLTVDRIQARYGAWYEMFHRSQGTDPHRSATFADCVRRLPDIRAMGFDVVYLVPVHPIGRIHRKGANNSLRAGRNDPGSPYAIGSQEGGHDAIHPDLGTIEDFRAFVRTANAMGIEVAIDFAIQCAPDHPWVREHPEWFRFRPDGTIRYAENPPKKYEDIVNVDFQNPASDALWLALRDVVLFWVAQGVRIFRVDNPHTKPVPFWEWLIRDVQGRHPDVLFLSEAFTRPPMLNMLAKVGFSQSYTYFTWRNFKHELQDYLTELTQAGTAEYLRPNFFPSTPDILPEFLQKGGRPAFIIRFVLAATLSSIYGIYNGFELCENRALPGREEYADSEKYEHKVWDWDRPGNIKDVISRVNRIRRENPALWEFNNLRFYEAEHDSVLFYGKMTPSRDNMIFLAVNLDPFEAHAFVVLFPLWEMGIPEDAGFEVEDLFEGRKYLWHGSRQRLELDPHRNPAAILRVTPWRHVSYRDPCF